MGPWCRQQERGPTPLAVSWTPLDAAETPTLGQGHPARLGSVSTVQLFTSQGAPSRAPADMALTASPTSVLLMGCSAVGWTRWEPDIGLVGAPAVPLGHPRLAVVCTV